MSEEAAIPLSCYLQAVNVSKVKCEIVPCSCTLSAFTFDLMSVEHYSLAMLTLLLSFFGHWLAGLHAMPVLLHHSMPLQFHSSLNLKCIRPELQSLGNFTNPSPLSAI